MSFFKSTYTTKYGFLRARNSGKLSPACVYVYTNGLIVIEDEYNNKWEGQRESNVSFTVSAEGSSYDKFLVAE